MAILRSPWDSLPRVQSYRASAPNELRAMKPTHDVPRVRYQRRSYAFPANAGRVSIYFPFPGFLITKVSNDTSPLFTWKLGGQQHWPSQGASFEHLSSSLVTSVVNHKRVSLICDVWALECMEIESSNSLNFSLVVLRIMGCEAHK